MAEEKTFLDKVVLFVKDLAIGGTAAAISKTINSPLEVTKLILQTQPDRYNGLMAAFRGLLKEEGVVAFWRGNGTNVLRYFPTQALNFAFKGYYKNLFMPLGQKGYSYWSQFGRGLAAGGAAGASSLIFVYPLDLARTRLSTDKKGGSGGKRLYNGLIDCCKKTWVEGAESRGFYGGIRALYKGFNISVAGIIPYRAVYFGGYDTLKSIFMPDGNGGFWFKWLISQTNTIIAQYITYPIDTVRRTLMKAGEKDHTGKASRTFNGAWDCAKYVYRTKGFVGIYRGSLANTFRATGGALCMVFYDQIKEMLAAQEEANKN